MIKVIICMVGRSPKVELIDDPFRNTKEALIGGAYVITVPLLGGVRVYCDEDGDSKKLPYNRALPAYGPKTPPDIDFCVYLTKEPSAREGELGIHKIRGNFLLAQHDEKGQPTTMSSETQAAYLLWLGAWQTILCRRCGRNRPTPSHIYCGAACSAQAEARL